MRYFSSGPLLFSDMNMYNTTWETKDVLHTKEKKRGRKQLPGSRERELGGVKPNPSGMSVCCFVNWIIFGNSIFIRASFLSYLYLYNTTSLYALQSRGTIPTTLSVFFAVCVLVLHSCGDCIPQECPTSFLLLFLIWKENKRQGEKFFKSLDRIRIRGKGRYITRNNVVSRRRKAPRSAAEESPVYKWNVLEMGRRTKARTKKMKM